MLYLVNHGVVNSAILFLGRLSRMQTNVFSLTNRRGHAKFGSQLYIRHFRRKSHTYSKRTGVCGMTKEQVVVISFTITVIAVIAVVLRALLTR